MNEIMAARKVIREAFESDPEFKHTYIATIAVILYDYYGTEHDAREAIAEKILDTLLSA